MGARPSTTQAALRRRQRIISATRELLRERDADKVLVTDVADRAGVSVATIYNLVGTRDRMLVAVLEDTIVHIRKSVATAAPATGVDACLAIAKVSCDVVLADPGPQRAVIGVIGAWGPDVWLVAGMETLYAAAIEQAVADGAFVATARPDVLADSLLLAHRGVLISWVFHQLTDADYRRDSELMALQLLANAAVPALRADLLRRIDDLAMPSSTTSTNTTTASRTATNRTGSPHEPDQ